MYIICLCLTNSIVILFCFLFLLAKYRIYHSVVINQIWHHYVIHHLYLEFFFDPVIFERIVIIVQLGPSFKSKSMVWTKAEL